MKAKLSGRRSDADLVREALLSRAEAFETLVSRYQRKACGIALGIGVRPDAVQDVLQEAFLQGFRDLPDLRTPASFGPWFLSIVRNVARKSLRARGRMALAPSLDDRVEGYSDGFERSEFSSELWRRVDALPEGVREAILLYYYEGESVRSVAATLGIGRSAVKNRLQKGRDLLREKLWKEMGDHLREMLPSAREWRKGARRLTLIIMAALPASWAGTAKAASAAAEPAGLSLPGALTGGVLLMGGKKLVAVIVVTLLLGVAGFLVVRPGGDGGEREVDRGLSDEVSSAGKEGEADLARGSGENTDGGAGVAARPLPSELPPPVDLEAADRDLDLFGVVVDGSDAPVAGANVETIIHPWRRVSTLDLDSSKEEEEGPKTRSAGDGTFSVRLRRGQEVDLRVSAPGYAVTVLPKRLAGEKVRVVLPEAARLEVVVIDEGSEPVEGVRVQFWRIFYYRESTGSLFDTRRGVTDESGRFLFTEMHPGKGVLTLEHDVIGSPLWKDVEVPAAETVRVEVTLPKGRTIRGRVTDVDTGLPITGARVGASWVQQRVVSTDEGGRYEFPGWTGEGVRDLHVVAEGYGRQAKFVPREGELDFELRRGDMVVGSVVDAAREPVISALVSAVGSRWGVDRQMIDTRSTRTDEEGRFSLAGLRTEMPHTVIIQARGHGRLSSAVFGHSQALEGLIDLGVLTLPAARAIEGRAIGEDEKPLSDVTIVLTGPDREADYGNEETRRTDDLGRFRFPDLAPASYSLSLRLPGRPALTREVVLPEDRDLLGVEMRVESRQASKTLTLTVRVEGPSGAPLGGAEVAIYGASFAPVRGRTGEDGTAVIPGLPDSEVQVHVSGGSDLLTPSPKRVVPRGQEVLFVLQEAAWVRGVVLAPDGSPLPGMHVEASFHREGVSERAAYCDEEGAFAIACPHGESMDLVVSGRRLLPSIRVRREEVTGYRGERGGVTAPASGILIQTREVAYDRSLTVLVLDPEGGPTASALVALQGIGIDQRRGGGKTNSEGWVIFEDLPAEPVSLIAVRSYDSDLPEEFVPSEWVTVIPDGQEVTLRLRKGFIVTGVVLDPRGEPVVRAQVDFYSGEEHIALGAADEAGRFRQAVPVGRTYRLSVRHRTQDGRVLEGALEGVTESTGEIMLRLARSR